MSSNENTKSANKALDLLKSEPVFTNGDTLHNNIMSAIEEKEMLKSNKKKRVKFIAFVKVTLKAASILLIAIFGYEQYIVTDKIITLENKQNTITNTRLPSSSNILTFNSSIIKLLDRGNIKSDYSTLHISNVKNKLINARITALANSYADNRHTETGLLTKKLNK